MKRTIRTCAMLLVISMLIIVCIGCNKVDDGSQITTPEPEKSSSALEPNKSDDAEKSDVSQSSEIVKLAEGESAKFDIDADGKDETIKTSSNYDEHSITLRIIDGSDRHDDVINATSVTGLIITDLDPSDDMANIVLSVDEESCDYATRVYSYDGNKLEKCSVRSRDTDGKLVDRDYIFGTVVSADADCIVVNRAIDILGTWTTEATYTLVDDGSFTYEQDDTPYVPIGESGTRVIELEVKEAFDVEIDGKEGKLRNGDKISMIETDGYSYVMFSTEDGANGKFDITVTEYGVALIEGNDCGEYFKELSYAG